MATFAELKARLVALDEGETYLEAVDAMQAHLRKTHRSKAGDAIDRMRSTFTHVVAAIQRTLGPVQQLVGGAATSEERDVCFAAVGELVAAVKAHSAAEAEVDATTTAAAADTPAACTDPPAQVEALQKEVEALKATVADLNAQLAAPRRPSAASAATPVTAAARADAAMQAARIEEALDRISAVERHSRNVKSAYRETRQLRMDTLYEALYKGRGMGLVWSAIRTVFKAEYAMRPAHAHRAFCEAFSHEVGQHMRGEERFEEALSFAPTLRMMYFEECERVECRPNSAVLKELLAMDDGGDAATRRVLDLSHNYLSAGGLRALLPTLQHMRGLERLVLRNNGLDNDSVKQLVEELRDHPSITAVDLSENRVSREGGKEVAQLLVLNPRIAAVDLTGTRVEQALQQRIAGMLAGRAGAAAET